ncbi:hypothetical protein OV208_33105 [Corallococcus sp. bb12-1]|uniref:imm11 family protein n=1 Tax=Corallococcus sp. bb12-1 TaxID=2996784 RepID=UPI0022707BD3|nr:DUF1629 domain-containing protein [Corallococcus sp. bb12-1]MCY1046197.1 hypothetical protein [Corallococcus sp. bb12-1]
MAHDYFLLIPDRTDENCLVNTLPGELNKTSWPAAKGVPMADKYPSGVRLEMAARHLGLVVPDFVPNTLLLYLVSGRMKTLLEQEAGVEIEFLPFALHDHKGRAVAPDCSIANVIGSQDCADLKKTRGEKTVGAPGKFEVITQLQLDPVKVSTELKLFRLGAMPRFLIIRDDLRATFEQNGVTGVRYVAMGERGYFV